MRKKWNILQRLLPLLLTFGILLSFCSLPAKAFAFTPPFTIQSESGIVLNLDTNMIIYEKNADKQQMPAHLAQIVTALVVLDACDDLDGTKITMSQNPMSYFYDYTNQEDVRYADIMAGDTFSVREYLYAMLLESSCESAEILADYFGDGNEVKSDYICVYAGGELVGGTEPNGSTPKPAETTTTSTTTATTTTTTTTTVTNATTTESEVSTTSATEVTTTESKPATTTSLTEATTTESTTTATTEAGAEIYYGDVNQDGVVDLADAIVMNKALANVITLSESAGKCADCYDDGILDDKDATILMRFVIGKINDVPSKEL